MIRGLITLIILVAIFIYLSIMNPQSVTINIYKDLSYTLPLSFWIIILIVTGLFLGYLLSFLRLFWMNVKLSSTEKRLKKEEVSKTLLVESILDEFLISPEVALKIVENPRGDRWLSLIKGRLLRRMGNLKEAMDIHSDLYVTYSSGGHFLREFLEDLVADGRFEEAQSILKNKDVKDLLPSTLYVLMDEAEKRGYYGYALFFGGLLLKSFKLPQLREKIVAYELMDLIEKNEANRIKKLIKSNPQVISCAIASIEYLDLKSAQEVLMQGYKRTANPIFLFLLAQTVSMPGGYNPDRIIGFMEQNSGGDLGKSLLAYSLINLSMYEKALEILNSIEKLTIVDIIDKLLAERKGGRFEDETIRELMDILKKKLFKFKCPYCLSEFYELKLKCDNCNRISPWKIDYGI